MNYESKYKSALGLVKLLYKNPELPYDVRNTLCKIFPELKESESKSEDELTWLTNYIEEEVYYLSIDIRDNEDRIKLQKLEKSLAWLKKQGEQKPIMDIPSKEVIFSIWDLGNRWKEITKGRISELYGTQLDYIQKHWHESDYYKK